MGAEFGLPEIIVSNGLHANRSAAWETPSDFDLLLVKTVVESDHLGMFVEADGTIYRPRVDGGLAYYQGHRKVREKLRIIRLGKGYAGLYSKSRLLLEFWYVSVDL